MRIWTRRLDDENEPAHLILQSLAVVILLVPLLVALIVYIALFNQQVLDRLIKLITVIPSLWK